MLYICKYLNIKVGTPPFMTLIDTGNSPQLKSSPV